LRVVVAAVAALPMAWLGGRAVAEQALQPRVGETGQEAYTVGDLIPCSVVVPLQAGEELLPVPADLGVAPFELRAASLHPGPGGTEVRLTLSVFQVGHHRIPPLALRVRRPDGSTRTVKTTPASVTVQSVLLEQNPQFLGIRGPVRVPVSPAGYVVATLAALVLLVAAVVVVRVLWRRRQAWLAAARERAGPPLSADEAALRDLQRLREARWPEQGALKRFADELSRIVRVYISERYGIPALERTTYDLARSLRRHASAGEYAADALGLLEACDLVKFAKARPRAEHCELLVGDAEELVRRTRAVVPSAAEAEPSEAVHAVP